MKIDINSPKPSSEFFKMLYDAYYKSDDKIRTLSDEYKVSKTYIHEILRGNFISLTTKRLAIIYSLAARYNIIQQEIIRIAEISNGFLVEKKDLILYVPELIISDHVPDQALIKYVKISSFS